MKPIHVIAAVMMIALASCMSKSQQFKESTDLPNVTTLRVNSAITGFANAALKSGNVSDDEDMAKYMKSIDDIEVVSCDDSDVVTRLSEVCDSIIASMNYELLMESSTNGDVSKIFAGIAPDDTGHADGLIVVSHEDDGYHLVYLKGDVDLQKLNDRIQKEKE